MEERQSEWLNMELKPCEVSEDNPELKKSIIAHNVIMVEEITFYDGPDFH